MRQYLQYAFILIGAFLIAAAFNFFLIPNRIISGGVSGIAMLAGYFTEWNIAGLYALLNIPLAIWGLFAIGRRFIMLSFISVVCTTWFMAILPINPLDTEPDMIIGAVFGGALIGIGSGISLRAGGSSGGFDILGSILTRHRDFPLGNMLFFLNGLVILAMGQLEDWDAALYSMLCIYITGKIVDTIHIRHVKVTAFIITEKKDEMLARLLRHPRGVTIIRTVGAYSHKEKDMLMTVTTRYELSELRSIIREVDPRAFVNIVETVEVLGEFRKIKS